MISMMRNVNCASTGHTRMKRDTLIASHVNLVSTHWEMTKRISQPAEVAQIQNITYY